MAPLPGAEFLVNSPADPVVRIARYALKLLRRGMDRGFVNRHRRFGTILRTGRNFADFLDDGQAGGVGCFSEGGILPVEVRHLLEADKELRSGRIGIVRAGHRHDSRFMFGVVEFGLDRVTGSPGAAPYGTPSLN